MIVKLIFSSHVVTQMFKRGISVQDIEHVINTGTVIKDYPDDKPYPSRLILGFAGKTPLHVVSAKNMAGEIIVITAYQPDKALWNSDFTIKNK